MDQVPVDDIDYGAGWLSEEYCAVLRARFAREFLRSTVEPIGPDVFAVTHPNHQTSRYRIAPVGPDQRVQGDVATLRYHAGRYHDRVIGA